MAVPPQAQNPSAYVSGLIHVAPVYLAFESLWQVLLLSHDAKAASEKEGRICGLEGCQSDKSPVESQNMAPLYFIESGENVLVNRQAAADRVHSILVRIFLPRLARSSSLLLDIRSITGWPKHVVDEQVKAVSSSGRLGEFIAHIKRSVGKNPHVLLAYAWVLYMALFSGGRYIRATLEAAGHEFWSKTSDPVQPSNKACEEPIPVPNRTLPDHKTTNSCVFGSLEFFRFATPLDGEDLKTEFKKRLLESEALLTSGERDDIVQEAICIFENMNLLVAQLDRVVENRPTTSSTNSLDGWASFLTVPLLGGRLRDSVALTKERSLKALSMAAGIARRSSADPPPLTPERPADSSQPDLERRQSLSGPSTSSTSHLEAHGTMTSSAELAEKASVPQSPVSSGAGAANTNPIVKIVRFGRDNAATATSNVGEQQTLLASTDGGEAEFGVRRERILDVPLKRKSIPFVSTALLWNIALILGVTAVFYSYGHARR